MKVIIETAGAQLSLQNGMLVIETGEQTKEIALLHVTSIHLMAHARLSTALLTFCIQNQIPVFIETDIRIEAMIWSPQFGSNAQIRRHQILFSMSSLKYQLIKRILMNKNQERILWLQKTTSQKDLIEQIRKINQINRQIAYAPDDDNQLRSLEAHASKIFFQIVREIIPVKFHFKKRTYQNSSDPFNSFLNYAYGMLYKYLYKATIVAGLDPDTGFFHAIKPGRPALTYDLIENYRPWIEKQIVQLTKNKTFLQIEKHIDDEGKITQAAKKMIIEQITQFMHGTKIKRKNLIRTPATHIQLDMHHLAQYLLKIPKEKLIKTLINKTP